MSTPTERRWVAGGVTALIAVFLIAGAAVLLRPVGDADHAAAKRPGGPRVELARLDEGRAGRLLREQATIFDPTPLFLPTRWNAGQQPLPGNVVHQPWQVFSAFKPKLEFGDEDLKLPIHSTLVVPRGPLDLLKQPSREPFLGFDRRDEKLVPLAPRYGLAQVWRTSDGKLELSQAIDEPVVTSDGPNYWRPAQFLVVVTVTGLLGRPVRLDSEGSGSGADAEEVDSFLRDYLVNHLHLGARLEPGVYRVVMGP